ncbi:type II secretion system protein GspD [Pararhodobacter marinus]|uniref:Type II secretion system protein GspD n=1 Tax=Pararhodobacter marinus TaxID=2184063 RepID=A0A2U2C7E8_9RHOB|nr:secretin N-terminal domain-containing protein [Pararhodobacter marinus]PWE27783.1 type II secretion system protein GspD [Pararhodobacter marinus]
MNRLAALLIVAVLALTSVAGAVRAQIRLDLRDVDLRSYIQLVSEQTNRNFLIDPQVQGSVSVFAPVPVSPAASYEIFLNVLELNGLAIVEGEGIDRIVPMRAAPGLAPGTTVSRAGGAFVTRVIPVPTEDLAEVFEVVQPLVPPEAILTPVPSAGLLILSDRRENIGRIEQLVARLGQASNRSVETIRLNHAVASELIGVLQTALPSTTGAGSVAADAGGNAIVVSGPSEYRDRVRSVVMQLDRPQVGPTSRVVRLNYAQATELAEVVRESMGGSAEGEGSTNGVTVVAEPQSNSLLITAPRERMEAIARAVQALDVRPSQVLIEAVIFEISAENFSDLSVQFGGLLNQAIGGGTSFSMDGRSSLITLIASAMAGGTPNPGNGGFIGYNDGNFAALITAIARERTTRLLSTPAVLTLNNQEAEIVVAQNVPFVTGQYSSTEGGSAENPFQTIERQDVGLTLTVTPQITDDATVRMAIAQEVSNLTGSTSAAGGEITARRRLSTNALVGDGEVIILGGLIEDNSTSQNQRVPGLSAIPVVGQLFRGRSVQEGQRVLLIMLRPRVVRSETEAQRITREIAREGEALSRQIMPRSNAGLYPDVRRTGFPFDGVDLNQPFDQTYVDQAVRDRLFPPLPPRLNVDVGQ